MTKHALPSRRTQIVGRYDKEMNARRIAAERHAKERTDFFRRYAAASGVSPGDINADLDTMLLLFSEQDIDAAKAEHAADLARIEAERDWLMRRMEVGREDAQYSPYEDLQRLNKANEQLRELRAQEFNKERP